MTSSWNNPNRRRLAIVVSVAPTDSPHPSGYSHRLLYMSLTPCGAEFDITEDERCVVAPARTGHGAAELPGDAQVPSLSLSFSSGRFRPETPNERASNVPALQMSQTEILSYENLEGAIGAVSVLAMRCVVEAEWNEELSEINEDLLNMCEVFGTPGEVERSFQSIVNNQSLSNNHKVIELLTQALKGSDDEA